MPTSVLSRRAWATRLRVLLPWVGWGLVVWVIVFWRLGYPSFWDPGDEAHYAQASREMLAAGNWLVPTYNGHLFPDKPPLFYMLQILAYQLVGPTELAARLVPACSAIALFIVVGWFGRQLFGPRVGSLGALMLAVLPATFALSSYAILDMTFTAFLFAGLALLVVSALYGRPRLQYGGFVCVALAVLTKGPLGLVLITLALGLAFAATPALRRPLLTLRWASGAALIAVLTLPWFLFMWWRFGDAFIDGYALRENVWLYTRGLTGAPTSPNAPQLSYTRVLLVGLLPWTPVLAGRIIDLARGLRVSTEERVLWAFAVAVTAFFGFSRFKLDHYVYPVAPALCLIAAQAWLDLKRAPNVRTHIATAVGIIGSGLAVAGGGFVLVPLLGDVPRPIAFAVGLVPIAMVLSGAWLIVEMWRGRLRPSSRPLSVVTGMLVVYTVVLVIIVPEFERAKPVKDLARRVAASVPADAVVGAYRMDRWNTSWRFYVEREVSELSEPDGFDKFMDNDEGKLCLMLQQDFDSMVAAGRTIHIVQEHTGLTATSGRSLKRNGIANLRNFVIVARNPRARDKEN